MRAGYVFIACLFLAWLEIQIEGAHGWAKNLPTWRGQPSWAAPNSRFFSMLRRGFASATGGNELTGYHLTLTGFLLVVMLMPVLYAERKLSTLAVTLGFFFVTTVTWDFLWFVFNPAFGMSRFRPEFLHWHPRWIGPMPAAYPAGYVTGAALISLGYQDWSAGVIAVLAHASLTALCILLVELRRPRASRISRRPPGNGRRNMPANSLRH